MSLESKVADYQKAALIVAACNAFQPTALSSVVISSSDNKQVNTEPFFMGTIDIAVWITSIRNQATAKRTAIKQESIDILNSGV